MGALKKKMCWGGGGKCPCARRHIKKKGSGGRGGTEVSKQGGVNERGTKCDAALERGKGCQLARKKKLKSRKKGWGFLGGGKGSLGERELGVHWRGVCRATNRFWGKEKEKVGKGGEAGREH